MELFPEEVAKVFTIGMDHNGNRSLALVAELPAVLLRRLPELSVALRRYAQVTWGHSSFRKSAVLLLTTGVIPDPVPLFPEAVMP
jgi:hypothetical protein